MSERTLLTIGVTAALGMVAWRVDVGGGPIQPLEQQQREHEEPDR